MPAEHPTYADPGDPVASHADLAGTALQGSVVVLPLAEQVYRRLRTQIVHGEIPAGTRLRVRDLAEAHGTSVMPVREAIRRLVEAGLATHEAYKGARVRGLNVEELRHAYDVRILVEGEAARLGALTARPEVADRMSLHHAAIEDAVAEGDVLAALQADERLLDTLYECTENQIMVGIIHGLWEKCLPYKTLWASTIAERNEPGAWHFKADLIDAVRANDGVQAKSIIHESYRIAQLSIQDVLTEQD